MIIGLTTNTLRNDNGERYDGIVLTGLNPWHHRIITHINSQQRVPSIGENLSDEFGNLTNRSVNNAVFASLPVELRDAYLRGMELQREYDDSVHEEQSYRQTYGNLEEMKVKLENSTSAIELYSGIENSARKSLLEWAKIADETSKDTPDSNITQNNNEHILPDERITEIYKTLSYLRKKAQVLVLSCWPDQEKT